MDDCKLWSGRLNEYGYGTIGKDLAHRRAWETQVGPIPADYTIDHLCHVPEECDLGVECPHRRCVNVNHMTLATAAENRTRSNAGKPQSQKTHCPRQHEYTGDNLLVSGGRRYCRTCRREALRERRVASKAVRCRSLGHERVDTTGVDGRNYCAVCNLKASRLGTVAQWGPDSLTA